MPDPSPSEILKHEPTKSAMAPKSNGDNTTTNATGLNNTAYVTSPYGDTSQNTSQDLFEHNETVDDYYFLSNVTIRNCVNCTNSSVNSSSTVYPHFIHETHDGEVMHHTHEEFPSRRSLYFVATNIDFLI